jgi:hypothetical protein
MLLSCKDGGKASLLASCATDITTLTTSSSLEVLQVCDAGCLLPA